MMQLYSSAPARPGYYVLWPLGYAGPDLPSALVASGINLQEKAVGWAIADDSGVRRVNARDIEQVRVLVSREKSARALLLRAVAGHAKTLWQTVEELNTSPSEDSSWVDTQTGIVVMKASPADKLEIKSLARRLSNSLRTEIAEPGRRAVKRFLEGIDVKFSELDATKMDEVFQRARAHLSTLAGNDMMGAWSKQVTLVVEDTQKAVKQTMKTMFLPSINTSLFQPEKTAANAIGSMAGFWARDRFGAINDQTTKQARKIIADGLRLGLGNADIAQDLRSKIPDLYEMRTGQYAETVANVAVQRGRTSAQLASYEEAGVQVLEIQAVLDELTTEQCRFMDGQIIEVSDARAVFDAGVNVKDPKDIAKVNPFIQEKYDRATGERWLQAGGSRLATIDRRGSGGVDDRGSMRQHVGGKGFVKAGIGLPPYHFRCRTYTVPRFELVQVPRNYMGRTLGSAARVPVDPKRPTTPKPVTMFRQPTSGKAQAVGTELDIDYQVLPPLQDAASYSGAKAQGALFQWSGARWQGKDFAGGDTLDWFASAKDFLPRGRTGLVDLYSGAMSPRNVAVSLIANSTAHGKDLLIRHVVDGGQTSWSRLSLSDITGVRREIKGFRQALAANDTSLIDKAAAKLEKVARKRGLLRAGEELGGITDADFLRVTTRAAEGAGRQPHIILVSSIKPGKIIGDTSTEALPISNDVFSARPAPLEMLDAAWEDDGYRITKLRLDSEGRVAKVSDWEKVSRKTGRPDLDTYSLSVDDNVVSLYVRDRIDLRDEAGRARLSNVLEESLIRERAAAGRHRDWVVSGPAGEAYYLRVDKQKVGQSWAEVKLALETVKKSSSVATIRAAFQKAGVGFETDVRKAWKTAKVDWTQPNYLSGVPISEQVDKRIDAVKRSIQTSIEIEERRLGREMSAKEYYRFLDKRFREVADTAGAKDKAWVQRVFGDALEEKAAKIRTAWSYKRTNYDSIEILGRADAKKTMAKASEDWGGGLSRAVAIHPMPIIAKDTKFWPQSGWNRAQYHPRAADKALAPGDKTAFGGLFLGLKSDVTSLKHEFAHHVEDMCPRVNEAAKWARMRGVTEGKLVRLTKDDGGPQEWCLPARGDKYSYKVYGAEATDLPRGFQTVDEWKKVLAKHADNSPWDGTEYFSQGMTLLHKTPEQIKGWYMTDPDQVSFLLSVLSGHFTPF